MSWVFVDDHANEDERLCDAGGLAAWYHTAGAHGFCRRKEHLRRPDGKALDFVPEAAALGLCASYTASQAKACLAALLRVGLWERVDGGYRLTDYADRYKHEAGLVLPTSPPPARPAGDQPTPSQLGGKARAAGASRGPAGTFQPKPAGVQPKNQPTGPAKPAPRASDPVPDPEPIKQKPAAKDLSGSAHAEPAAPAAAAATSAIDGLPEQLPNNLAEALELPICSRAKVVVEHTERAEWLQPHKWPELLRVAEALHEACGLGEVRLASYSRDSGVRAIVTLFDAGYMPSDLLKACRLLPGDAWWSKEGSRRGLASLSPEVVRRVLATGLSPAQAARVARALGERPPSPLGDLLATAAGAKP